jgi:uncharacterized membrane protein YedE/YeeE
MNRLLAALVAGLLFGLGLTVARMIDPAKVLGFLDLAGSWDPSLAFVLGGAVATSAIGFHLAGRRAAPLFADAFQVPTARSLDRRLILGSALFGIGWGLVGICPGPALAGLAVAPTKVALFVVAMLVGMAAFTVTGSAARSLQRA